MKKLVPLLLFLLCTTAVFAQSPHAIHYQAVARASDGNILLNQEVLLRISILSDSVQGPAVYEETHATTSSSLGLINLDIGTGTVETGDFTSIPWGSGRYFIKLDFDPTGTGAYEWLGTTQLLSVPYAFYANEAGIRKMTDQERDAITDPQEGMIIYNLTTGCLNVRNPGNWFEICGAGCVPQPTMPDAGEDRNVVGTSLLLAGNDPVCGTGTWSVVSGAGGQFTDIHSPTSQFSGLIGNSYELRWTIANSCSTHYDDMTVRLCYQFAVADAGSDQLDVTGSTVNLSAGDLTSGESGQWAVIAGAGGSLGSSTSPTSTFTGIEGHSYYLVWTKQNACGFSGSDTVHISFSDTDGITCPGIPKLTYMGQEYHTVKIGDQCWMRENLNSGNMLTEAVTATDNGIIEKHCYGNDPLKCLEYGGLYTWDEMMDYSTDPGVQGICPSGWHLPTDADFTLLCDYLGGTTQAGGKLKETGNWHWAAPNISGDNESGFRALAAGYMASNGGFSGLLTVNYFFTSNQHDSYEAWGYGLSWDSGSFLKGSGSKTHSNSVRCLRNQCLPMGNVDAGPDQPGVVGNTTVLAATCPAQDETGTWTILSGTGGQLTAPTSCNSGFSGVTGETYSLKWTLTDTCSQIAFDTLHIGFTALMAVPCPGIPTVVHGGQTYNTVKIGNQCWFKENLNIGTMVLGASTMTNNGTIEKYCNDNNPANCAVYGAFYQWGELMQYSTDEGVQGICPDGWHIPTNDEWCTMLTFLEPGYDCELTGWQGDFLGGKLKETGYTHWNPNNNLATNETGFTAIGSGNRDYYGGFTTMLTSAGFYTSTATSVNDAISFNLWYGGGNVLRQDASKLVGYSVRCLKN